MEKASYHYQALTANGPLRSLVIIAGLELEIFDYLSEPVPSADLAEKIGCHPVHLTRFLNALAAIELIEQQDGFYWNHPLTQFFLTTESPAYLGGVLLVTHRARISGLEPLVVSVKQGLRASMHPGKTRPPRPLGLKA